MLCAAYLVAQIRLIVLAEEWLRSLPLKLEPSLKSSSLDWEMAIVRGHPTHPVGSFNSAFATGNISSLTINYGRCIGLY